MGFVVIGCVSLHSVSLCCNDLGLYSANCLGALEFIVVSARISQKVRFMRYDLGFAQIYLLTPVRSIDLDSWSDMHIEPMLKWGNKRANMYWEHKLPEGYVPDESKIQNFIRTKYDLKRWAMSGPMPDPSTLDAGAASDDTPLAEVQKQAAAKLPAQQPAKQPARTPSSSVPAAAPSKPQSNGGGLIDFFDDAPAPAAPKPTVATSQPSRPAQAAAPAVAAASAPGSQKPADDRPAAPRRQDSLLGLDFNSSPSPAATARPASAPNSGASSRLDLKKSILSLYAAPQRAPMSAAVQSMGQSMGQPAVSGGAFGAPAQNHPTSPPAQPSPFDFLSSQTSSLSLGASPASVQPIKPAQPQTQASHQVPKPAHQPSVFDDLIGSNSGSQWASTPTSHPSTHQRKASADEWDSFTSAPAAPKSSIAIPPEDDLFANVWK